MNEKDLALVRETLKEAKVYEHAGAVLSYDQETICPPAAMEEQGETMAFLWTKAYECIKRQEFMEAVKRLAEDLPEDSFDRALIKSLYREQKKFEHITPEQNHAYSLAYNKAFVRWLEAKEKADFSVFAPELEEVRRIELEKISLREEKKDTPYDSLLDDYEPGITSKDLDDCFGACKDRLVPLLKRIQAGPKQIRTDFMEREVSDEAQVKMADWLLRTMGFDFERGAFTTSEHPFTSGLAKNDVRVTTHYYKNSFASSMYSIIHEGGHALFEQLAPAENHDHYLEDKTMGQHESVSRFYENLLGRSRAFVHLVWPKALELFPEALSDVTEEELYLALNTVTPSLIRTESDEFTYTFHIIIRYEIEKAIVNDQIPVDQIPALWKQKYREYLGVEPANDREGALQDMHWTGGFGYFPAYALGNMYNAMYYKTMQKDLDVEAALAAGDFAKINGWMAEHVFAKADRQDAKEWLTEITGENFSPDAFLDYLEAKYTAIYEI